MPVGPSVKPLVIGVGNVFRGDDGAGPTVARQLRAIVLEADIVEESGEGATLIGLWSGRERVFVVDAVVSGADAGTIFRFDAHAEELPGVFARLSSHAFGVQEAIELSRSLGQLPSRLIVYGIEGRTFETGATMSEPVRRSAEVVVKRISEELRSV